MQRQHEHIKNQRKDCFDKLVYDLIQTCDVIVIEDLKIKNVWVECDERHCIYKTGRTCP